MFNKLFYKPVNTAECYIVSDKTTA